MNPLKIKASLLLLLGGLLTASTAPAATLTYSNGDIFLGFRSTNPSVTRSYLINIGPGATFRDATTTLSLGNFSADLTEVFGASWTNDTNVKWGVVGGLSASAVGTDPGRTLYSSLAGDGTVPLTAPVGPNSAQASGQSVPANKIINMKDDWLSFSAAAIPGNPSIASGTNASFTTAANTFSYTTYAGGTPQPFAYFATALEGDFAAGTSGTSLNLFRNIPGSSTVKGTYEGTFQIDSSGNLSFSQIPEPSGAICLVLSGLALGIRRRRSSHR